MNWFKSRTYRRAQKRIAELTFENENLRSERKEDNYKGGDREYFKSKIKECDNKRVITELTKLIK